MLLKKEKPAQIDYLENWPEHYYEIENTKERKEILAQAISRGLDLPNDNYRMKLLEKRYGKDGKNDAFMKAWMMIKASGAAGISFFNKRHLQKELKHRCNNQRKHLRQLSNLKLVRILLFLITLLCWDQVLRNCLCR